MGAFGAYETEKGRREDLEALETNPVLGFIGEKIMPILNVMEKSGRLYYRTVEADSAAQTSRDSVTAPTRVTITDQSTTYTATEVIKGYAAPRDMVKQNGGIAVMDKIGGKAAKRSIQRFLEEEVADLVLLNGTATVFDIQASLIAAVQVGLEAIRRYPGRTAFVCSYTIFNRIMRFTEVLNRWSLSSAQVTDPALALAALAGQPNALQVLLKGVLGVDEILIGDDDQWYDSDATKQERAALVKLQVDPDEANHLLDPVFGKTVMYLPDGKQMFTIESFYDDDDKVNKYDASIWRNQITFNTGALYILEGIDESNTIVTSTTTTTT